MRLRLTVVALFLALWLGVALAQTTPSSRVYLSDIRAGQPVPTALPTPHDRPTRPPTVTPSPGLDRPTKTPTPTT